MSKFWSQPLRIETPDEVVHITSRTTNSALWFVNNSKLEERIHAFLAKYVEKYKVEIYAFQLVGNHYHLLAKFPESNMAAFQRDLNARIAESVRILVKNYREGSLFSRRYSSQIVLENDSIEHYFFYTALQPVSSKLCVRVSDYPGKNCLSDAASSRKSTYKYFDYGGFHRARRKNPKARRKKFWRYYSLQFTRLPGFESLSAKEYQSTIMKLAEKKRIEFIKKNIRENKGVEPRYMTKVQLKAVKPGTLPYRTKKSKRRPLVLSFNLQAKKLAIRWYMSKVSAFREAVEKFKGGEFVFEFPEGMYRPPGMAFT